MPAEQTEEADLLWQAGRVAQVGSLELFPLLHLGLLLPGKGHCQLETENRKKEINITFKCCLILPNVNQPNAKIMNWKLNSWKQIECQEQLLKKAILILNRTKLLG